MLKFWKRKVTAKPAELTVEEKMQREIIASIKLKLESPDDWTISYPNELRFKDYSIKVCFDACYNRVSIVIEPPSGIKSSGFYSCDEALYKRIVEITKDKKRQDLLYRLEGALVHVQTI